MIDIKDLKVGTLVRLKEDARPFTTEGVEIPEEYIHNGLWVIDEAPDHIDDVVNINKLLIPYPGAYCSNILARDIACIVK